MKNSKFILALFVCLFSQIVSADVYMTSEEREIRNAEFAKKSAAAIEAFSGADIVGNGGGAVEQAAFYIYRSLDRYITHCLNSQECAQSSDKRDILKKIRNVILENRDEKNHVIFLSNNLFQAYMQDETDPEDRVAKTGFDPELPNFINVEEAYAYSKSDLYPSMVALFVHEVGHQVGVASHSTLDELASEVREIFASNIQEAKLNYLNGEFKFTMLGSNEGYDFSQFMFSYNGKNIAVPALWSDFQCANGDKLVGVTLENIHWDAASVNGGTLGLTLKAWGQFYCEKARNKMVYLQQLDVQYQWTFNVQTLPTREYNLQLIDSSAKIR